MAAPPPPWSSNQGNYFRTPQDLEADILNSAAIIDPHQLGGTTTMAYPWGSDPTTSGATEFLDVIQKHFLSARDVSGYRISEEDDRYQPNAQTPKNMYKLDTFIYGGPTNEYDTAIVQLTKQIDDTLYHEGWGIEFTHGVEGENHNLQAYLEHLDYLSDLQDQGKMWIGTQADISKYIYSRDAAEIQVIYNRNDAIVITIDDNLDDAIYDTKITINVPLQRDWAVENLYAVRSDGQFINYQIVEDEKGDYIMFDKLADGKTITILSIREGDADGNGVIDENDLQRIIAHFGYDNDMGDANLDGITNLADLFSTRNNYYKTNSTAIPEPTSLILLTLGSITLIKRKHR